jgi:TetR/AcrR family transcriptional regulator, regulator of cefoperazone and chloramphenicol sensitivity
MSQNESDSTRARILEAAGQMFAERGFGATTVRDICDRAAANIAAVNYHFGDKQKLYVEAVVRAHRWRMEQFEIPNWCAATTPPQKLADFIITFLRRVLTGPGDTWHSRLIMREIAHPTEACAELVQSSIRPQFEILLSILRELLPEGTSEEKLHLTAFSVVGQCLFYHFADPVVRNLLEADAYESLDIEKLADHIAEFSLSALNQSAPCAGAKR